MPDLREHLREHFGLEDFRPAQREVIEDVLAGKDVLCVMPTGAGKSLCFQLPAAVQKGLTLVVSPLISLMQDQVQQLKDEGIRAAMLNSQLTPGMQRQVLRELEEGFDGLLYVAPERFFAANFQSLVEKLKPKLFAIDEAHCISSWGHDFRPEYSMLGEVRKRLGDVPTIALTATATDDVRNDIIRQLNLREPRVYITGFDRPNLRYECRNVSKVRDKEESLLQMLRTETGTGIVYCATRKAVDEVVELLKQNLTGRPIFKYHAGMTQDERTRSQETFMETARAIAVATNAFGMGINKPDIRFVVHYNLPGTLEAYYQEAGRAGRDGQPSRCTILFSYQDRYIHEFFIDKIGEESEGSGFRVQGSEPSSLNPEPQTLNPDRIEALKDHARDKLEMVINYARTHRCRRQMILDYFGDESDVIGCDCDVCRREKPGAFDAENTTTTLTVSEEVTTVARKLLSGIARVSMRGQFGVGAIAEVLSGGETERVQRWRFDELSVYGLLRLYKVKQIVAMLHRLMEAGLAKQVDPEGTKFMPVVELTAAGVEVMKGTQPPPAMLADLLGRKGKETRSSRVVVSPHRESLKLEAVGDSMDEESVQRFERLRAVRSGLAKERQLPPYCICHDTTLKSIAQVAPRDAASLELIKGMGPNKVRMYGEAFLNAIKGVASIPESQEVPVAPDDDMPF